MSRTVVAKQRVRSSAHAPVWLHDNLRNSKLGRDHPLLKTLVKKEDFLRSSTVCFLCVTVLISLAPSRSMEPNVSL